MATDNSPPKIRIILTVAFSSVVILFSLNYVFRAYFLMMTEEVEHDHLRPAEELAKLREGEQRNLTTSPMPIARAMQEIAKGREGVADISPQPSNDPGALVGWIRNPNQAVIDMLNAQAASDAGAPAPAPVMTGGDGGASPAVTTDGGAAPTSSALSDGGAAPTQTVAPTGSAVHPTPHAPEPGKH